MSNEFEWKTNDNLKGGEVIIKGESTDYGAVSTSVVKEIFCDSCGDSCMHDGFNYVGVAMNITGAPKSLIDKCGVDKYNVCYPCWFKSLAVLKVK